MLRIQLVNDKLGTLNIDKYDPIDINNVTQTIKRSEEVDGIVYEVVLNLEFIKAGRRFIKNAYETDGGIDAKVFVNIYQYDPNSYRWEIWYSGTINYNTFDLSEDKVVVSIEQIGFQKNVTNLKEVDVDLETELSHNGTALPSANTIDALPLHGKKILKTYESTPSSSAEFAQLSALIHNIGNCVVGPCEATRDKTIHGQIDTGNKISDELGDTFSYPFGFNEAGNIFEVYRAREAGVANIDFRLRFKMSIYATQAGAMTDVDLTAPCSDSGILANREVKLWFEHRNAQDIVKTQTLIGTSAQVTGCGGTEDIGDWEIHTFQSLGVTIEVGDKIYFYFTVRVNGTYEKSGGTLTDIFINHEIRITADHTDSFIEITSSTSFPDSTTKAILAFEAVERCLQYITSQEVCLKSDLLGRTDLGYAVDGEGSLIAFTVGGQIAQRDTPIVTRLQELLDFFNSQFAIGIGFEFDIDGTPLMRLEKKSYFYNKGNKIISIGPVYDIKRKILPDKFYNSFEFGYIGKIDADISNGLDEFNTIRRYNIPVSNTENQFSVATTVGASGFEIEKQRRLIGSTEDSKLDEKLFAIVVKRDGGNFVSKKNEGYTTILNIYDPATGYNFDISPGRALKNWSPYIASNIIRSKNKIAVFGYGEGNTTLETRKTGEAVNLVENENIDLSIQNPVWDNEVYEFNKPLTKEEIDIIKANPNGYIEFFDRFNERMEGFIDTLDHNEGEKTTEFRLLKVFR